MSLIDQTFLPELGQKPPDRFDVVVGAGYVGLIQIQPVTHPSGELVPLLLVSENALVTVGVELIDAVFLDGCLAVQPQFLLHLYLHRQPMRIPARLALHLEPAHGLVAAYQILDGAGDHVMNPRLSVGRRWAFIEHEVRSILSDPDALVKDVIRLPELEYPFLHLGIVEILFDLFEHCRSLARNRNPWIRGRLQEHWSWTLKVRPRILPRQTSISSTTRVMIFLRRGSDFAAVASISTILVGFKASGRPISVTRENPSTLIP